MKHSRKKGEGTLVKRGRNYSVRFIDDSGKIIVKALKTTNKLEADTKAKLEIADHNKKLERRSDNKIKLSEAFQEYLDCSNRPKSSDVTLKEYKRYWGKFVDYVAEDIYLHDVSVKRVDLFWSDLQTKTLAPQTQNKIKNFCHLLYKSLARSLSLNINPFEGIKNLAFESVPYRELSDDELESLKKECTGETKTLFLIGMYTGLRLKDASLLKWESIDLSNSSIKLIPHKTKKHKTFIEVPLLGELKTELFSKSIGESEYILPSIASSYLLQRSTISRRSSRIFIDAKIESNDDGKVGFHSLRHSFATICINSGVPMDIIQELIGHSNIKMTRHYSRIGLETKADAMKNFSIGEKTKILYSPSEVLEMVSQMTSENWQAKQKEILSNV